SRCSRARNPSLCATSSAWACGSSVFKGDLVGHHVHLGDVGLGLDVAGVGAMSGAQLGAAVRARPVEPLLDIVPATGAGDIEHGWARVATAASYSADTPTPLPTTPWAYRL